MYECNSIRAVHRARRLIRAAIEKPGSYRLVMVLHVITIVVETLHLDCVPLFSTLCTRMKVSITKTVFFAFILVPFCMSTLYLNIALDTQFKKTYGK